MLEARRAARLVVLAGATATAEAKAVDRFEIQVYDGAMNAPGVTSLENHVSFTDRGRRTGSGPEDPTHHQAHWTFEGALGVSPIWEPGLYLQTLSCQVGATSTRGEGALEAHGAAHAPREASPRSKFRAGRRASALRER